MLSHMALCMRAAHAPPARSPTLPCPRAASSASSDRTLDSAADASEDLWSEGDHGAADDDDDDDDDAWNLSPASAYAPIPLARPDRCRLDIRPHRPLPQLVPDTDELRMKQSASVAMAAFSDGDSELGMPPSSLVSCTRPVLTPAHRPLSLSPAPALSDDEDPGPSGPRYTHQRRLQTMHALFVQTNQELSEQAWCASAPRRDDMVFAQAVPVFDVANLAEDELAAVRAQLEQDDDDQEEKSFAYIHAPFPLPLTGRVDPASVAGGWPPALREYMIQSVVGLRERLLKPESVSMAIMIDPDTARDGFVTLLYLADEGDPQVALEAARLASVGINRGLDSLVREGVRVKAEEAWIALTTAELNLTMDEAVETHAQRIAPWHAPFGAHDVHQHLP